MKVIPLQKYLLLEVKEYGEAKNGLVIPQHLRKKIPRGKVIAMGDYCDCDCKEGDIVIFEKQNTKALPDDLVLVPDYRIILKG